jgi:hypothetical protein
MEMKSEYVKIELSHNGNWFGYPVTLYPDERPDDRVRIYQAGTEGVIRWRYWEIPVVQESDKITR